MIGNFTQTLNNLINGGWSLVFWAAIVSLGITVVLQFLSYFERRSERRDLIDLIKAKFLVKTGEEITEEKKQ